MQLVSIIGAHDSLRFAEIEDHLPTASTSTISKRLDEFEEAGLASRTQYNEIPPRVEYALTDDGDEVRTRLEPLLEWATENSWAKTIRGSAHRVLEPLTQRVLALFELLDLLL
jgi:DNA-binding HxlR family transcriptional regulator